MTPLMQASVSHGDGSSDAIIDVFLLHGADPCARDEHGRQPADFATKADNRARSQRLSEACHERQVRIGPAEWEGVCFGSGTDVGNRAGWAHAGRPLERLDAVSSGRSPYAAHGRITARSKGCWAAQRGQHHAHRFLPLRCSSDPHCKKAAAAYELQLLNLSPTGWALGLLRAKPSEDHGSQGSLRPLRMG